MPTPPTTVTARIYVAVDTDGAWSAAGGSAMKDREAHSIVHDDVCSTRRGYWVTVELPVPVIKTVVAAASVEGV